MRLIVALALLTFVVADIATAREASHVPVVGVLLYTNPQVHSPADRLFRRALSGLGYEDGKNIAFVYRWAEEDPDRLQKAAAELVEMRVDVIATGSLPALRAAKAATQSIPIVMGYSSDPVAEGIVRSLASPGGNITGLAAVVTPEIAGKRLELLKEVVPRATSVAVLFNPGDPTNAAELAQAKLAARALGITLWELEVRGRESVYAAFAASQKREVDGLLVVYSIETHEHRALIAEQAIERRLPSIGAESFAEAGGLMSYSQESYSTWRRAAEYVDKILRGANPADLPIEQASRIALVVNLRTAKRLALKLPQSVVLRADEVIR